MEWLSNNIEILGFTAAILGTCSLIPQVIKILRSRSTSGISLIMYIIIAIDSLLWLTYGFVLSLSPLIIQSLITCCCASIVIATKILWKWYVKCNQFCISFFYILFKWQIFAIFNMCWDNHQFDNAMPQMLSFLTLI